MTGDPPDTVILSSWSINANELGSVSTGKSIVCPAPTGPTSLSAPCFHSVYLMDIPWLCVADIWMWENIKKWAVQLEIDANRTVVAPRRRTLGGLILSITVSTALRICQRFGSWAHYCIPILGSCRGPLLFL